jgi:HlyD family secretion protein
MQIEAAISEADVGLLKTGQAVRYTVDAFPDASFEGVIQQIRNNYGVQQNVVTYTVVIRTRNEDERLRPGMTAYLKVAVAERADALRVPNAALRHRGPDTSALDPGLGRVWRVKGDGQIEALRLRLGLSDGQFTEVLDETRLQAGDALVIGAPPEDRRFGPRIF